MNVNLNRFSKKQLILFGTIGALLVLLVDIVLGYEIAKTRDNSTISSLQSKVTNLQNQNKKDSTTLNSLLFYSQREDIMMLAMDNRSAMKANLNGVNGTSAIGTAYILRNNGNLYFTASTSLPDPKKGTYYEGWVANKDGMNQVYLDGGTLTKQKDGTYAVAYEWNKTYDGANFVFITQETSKKLTTPGSHLLEGSAQ